MSLLSLVLEIIASPCFKEDDDGGGGEGEFDRENENFADGRLETNDEGVDISFL